MTVDEFVRSKVLPEYREIVAELRKVISTCAPDAQEVISYGVPMYKMRRTIAVISPTKKGITLAFSYGASFEDRYGLLEGMGNRSKNVRMKSVADVNRTALRYYLKQAVQHDAR